MKKYLLLTHMLFSSHALFASEDHHAHHNHENHRYAPIGIMGEHPHQKGEWMLSYRYGHMTMEGSQSNTDEVTTESVLNDFMVAPLEMDMTMHMFGAMRGINDKLTFMAMIPYKELTMDHKNSMGVNFTTESKGVGDIKLSALYSLYSSNNRKILLNTGINLPTGSIDKRDDTPSGANQKLPYPMQLGSGTYDYLLGLTYSDYKGKWSWGAQAGSIIHLGQNSEHYSLGDSYNLTIWDSYQINKSLTTSIRLDGKIWEDIDGLDPELNASMVPTARTDLRAGKKVDLLFGMNILVPNSNVQSVVSFEIGMPIYQKLDGPQLKSEYSFMVGTQFTF